MALAADLELRRRHPDIPLNPLKAAEPATEADSRGAGPVFSNHQQEQNAARTAAAVRQPDLGVAEISAEVTERVARIAQRAREARQQIDALASLPSFADEAQTVHAGPAWDVLARRQRDAIIQPPKPEIVPARVVLRRFHERAAEAELEPG
jgi:hypothetical protein